jgi:hypothetical protein
MVIVRPWTVARTDDGSAMKTDTPGNEVSDTQGGLLCRRYQIWVGV